MRVLVSARKAAKGPDPEGLGKPGGWPRSQNAEGLCSWMKMIIILPSFVIPPKGRICEEGHCGPTALCNLATRHSKWIIRQREVLFSRGGRMSTDIYFLNM